MGVGHCLGFIRRKLWSVTGTRESSIGVMGLFIAVTRIESRRKRGRDVCLWQKNRMSSNWAYVVGSVVGSHASPARLWQKSLCKNTVGSFVRLKIQLDSFCNLFVSTKEAPNLKFVLQ